ncbi:MAG: hypothetical protein GY819_14340 [Planctomycetaceae bacterium]|nr:hypothetical protein [Planctomycetaceae bacterium]MCP4463968.1 hypothetical protein [Planctomycetaceae bacterium]MDG2104475.1 hypothetical protein [Pirellulaceae bacterium]
MTELKFYRWIMGCLVLLAIGVGVKRYGDYRVNEFLSREAPGGVVAAAGYGGPGGREGGHSLPQISQQPLRQPPAADPWRAPATTAYAKAPLAIASSAYRSSTPGAMATLSDQSSGLPVPPSWRPPPEPVLPPAAPVAVPEDPLVAQLRDLKRQLGGAGVGEILSEGQGFASGLDTEAAFAEAVRELQVQAEQTQRVTEPLSEGLEMPVFAEGMEPEEIAEMQQHLQQFADRCAKDSPERAATYQQLANRLGDSLGDSGSHKR